MNRRNTVASIRRAIVETALAFGADGIDSICHLAGEAIDGIQPQTLAAYKAHKTMGTYNAGYQELKKRKKAQKKIKACFCLPCLHR